MSSSPEALILPIVVLVFEWFLTCFIAIYASIMFDVMSLHGPSGVGFTVTVIFVVVASVYLGLTILLTNGLRRGSVSALKTWMIVWSILLVIGAGGVIYNIARGIPGGFASIFGWLLRFAVVIVIRNHKNMVAQQQNNGVFTVGAKVPYNRSDV